MIEIAQSGDEWVLYISSEAAKNPHDAFEDYDPTIPTWDQEHKGPFGDNYLPTLREAVEVLTAALPLLREDI